MRKRTLCFFFATIVCTLLIGCNIANEEQNNGAGKVTEAELAEDETVEADTNIETETAVIISPLPNDIDINHLENGTLAVSLEQGDAYVDDTGAMQMDVTVYTYDLYDMIDIANLKEGDTIIIRGQEVKVTSLERTDMGLLINGGLDENGYELRTDESTVWYEIGYSDIKSYYEVGKATIRVSADMNFYDSSDLDKGEVIYYPGDFLTDKAGIIYYFVPNNTSIVIEDGMIIEMYRRYTP